MKSYYCKPCDVSFFVKPIKVDRQLGYVKEWACCCPRCGKVSKEVL
jgi:hypothetical protein